MRQVKRMAAEKITWMDVRPDVMKSFNNELQKDIGKVDVWQAQCGNDFYYRSSSGRLVTQWPHSMDAFVERTTQADGKAFEVGVAAR